MWWKTFIFHQHFWFFREKVLFSRTISDGSSFGVDLFLTIVDRQTFCAEIYPELKWDFSVKGSCKQPNDNFFIVERNCARGLTKSRTLAKWSKSRMMLRERWTKKFSLVLGFFFVSILRPNWYLLSPFFGYRQVCCFAAKWKMRKVISSSDPVQGVFHALEDSSKRFWEGHLALSFLGSLAVERTFAPFFLRLLVPTFWTYLYLCSTSSLIKSPASAVGSSFQFTEQFEFF